MRLINELSFLSEMDCILLVFELLLNLSKIDLFEKIRKLAARKQSLMGGPKMNFENTGFENVKADLNRLDDVMLQHSLVREGQWDYERVTYDRKFELNEGVFYLRVMGYAVEGDVGADRALIQLKTPLLGKYYYPHGVEYGDNENYPDGLVTQCQKLLAELKEKISVFAR